MPATTQTLPHNDIKPSTQRRAGKPTTVTSEKSIKSQKPTKWGEQLLVKMEALRKALAAQA